MKKWIMIGTALVAAWAIAEVTAVSMDTPGAGFTQLAKDRVTENVTNLIAAVNLNTTSTSNSTATLAVGISTNFTFLTDTGVTGQLWVASGVVTNFDANIGD